MAVRIEDISPRDSNTTLRLGRDFQSVSGKALCCALAADGRRAYLGGHSGVWRSDDGGDTWRHLEWPQPPAGSASVPGALLVTTVYDLLISPANPDVVLAAVGRDARRPDQGGVWRSADGGASWARVHQFVRGSDVALGSCLAVAPGDPNLVFAAGGFAVARSTDGGLTWTDSGPPQGPSERVWYVAAGRREGNRRRVYAVGSRVWFSRDGGLTWRVDPQDLSLGAPADGPGQSSRSLSVHPSRPRRLYLARFEHNPAINNAEGIVWRGEYPDIGSDAPAVWTRLAPMKLDFPNVTDSGGGFVVAHVALDGELNLIASDRRTVQIAVGEPDATADWRRIEDGRCHLDPHGLALTPDFRRHRPSGVPDPFPDPFPVHGRILLVNDGGANVSVDGARRWRNGRGLSTLGLVNVAINPRPTGGPAICMGMGDNFGFASPDGGLTWETQLYQGGDNDVCFSDPLQPSRVVLFAPRDGKGDGGVGRGLLHLYVNPDGDAPDTSIGSPHARFIPGAPPLDSKILAALGSANPAAALALLNAAWSAVSFFYELGYRPLVLTLRGQTPSPDGDFVVVRFTDALPELVRTTKPSLIDDAQFWRTNQTADGPGVRAFRVGPPLPAAGVCVVQAAGGHAAPVFYVGDQDTEGPRNGRQRLWKWTAGMAAWQQIVPAAGSGPRPSPPTIARRFFVDPYRPNLVYVVGDANVFRSDDGGAAWQVDLPLERAMTENGQFPFDSPFDGNPGQALIRDMKFDPDRPGARFAVGPAGVFHTLDGRTWSCLMRSSALAARPINAAYDFVSCPRALYVATSNRGLLRLSPLPPDWDFPLGSLQAAEGRITRLRVHELGGGFGPPGDRLDAEVIVELDSEPEKAFGLQLRANAERRTAAGMLDVLRDTFNRGRPVRIEFVRSGCRTGRIVRVIAR
jgi:photosystem II stability/assembly factor-like uncharacterized protein